ncbi:MAG: hypothetical protein KF725_14335 [Cyclobacteriaceae bacterium]|nr:hypothetical protein [Cyclobacteriaceae bacterium]UYN87461.1 MAG: hypothetical protein KIT51_04120 [Cyclobacteriaceae bacterium]
MHSRWFWTSWSLDYRVIGYILGAVLILSILFMWVGYSKGAENVIHWDAYHQQETIETVSHSFDIGNFELSIPIESYLTFEYFNGGNIQPNTLASYIFLGGLVLCSLIMLCVITTLERFWYFVGMGLFTLFMVSLRLEVLQLFGLTGRMVPIIILFGFILPAFYFNILRPTTPFLLRFLIFILLTVITAFIVHFFSAVDYPFLHLAVTAYVPGLVLALIFILMVAHEIPAAFVYITCSGTSSSKSLRHFSIISVVYMVNLVLAYMHEAKLITWDFLYINFYLLLTVSAVLGIWGFRQRETLYDNITKFNPFGAYFIVALAAITFLTGGLLSGNHNDPAIRIFRSAIIFSHIGYGAIFLIYIVSNFIIMMAENLNAWKVLYKPTRMPYFTFRFAGLIATLAFVFYSNWRELVYHGVSGFYNHLGDLYELIDKPIIAEAYYQQGRSYGFQNNRSNYALAKIEAQKSNVAKAHNHYELANDKRPTPFSLVNDANLLLLEGRTFESIHAFSRALKKFPHHGVIENNLGYSYTKIHKLDSAILFFDAARKHKRSQQAAEANILGLIGQEYLPVQADSLVRQFNTPSALTLSNALAVASLQKQSFDYTLNPWAAQPLDIATATLLNNYLVHFLKKIDTVALHQIDRIVSDSLNIDYHEALKATLAQAYYQQNNVTRALSIMGELAYLSQIMQGKFNYIAGLWALEQGCPDLALKSFNYAVQFDYKEARLYNAIALAEARYLPEARIAADSLLRHKNENIREIGRQLKKILDAASIDNLNDLEKYQFCRYRIGVADTVLFERVVNTIQDNDLKVAALIEMAERQFDVMHHKAATRYLIQTSGIPVQDKSLVEKQKHFELLLLAFRGDINGLASRLNSLSFDKKRELEKALYEALISEGGGDTQTAARNYAILATYNPFFEEGIIASARYFKNRDQNDMKAYSILAEAVQLNTNSYRLWIAYAAEAARVGFDAYAASALDEAEKLKSRK